MKSRRRTRYLFFWQVRHRVRVQLYCELTNPEYQVRDQVRILGPNRTRLPISLSIQSTHFLANQEFKMWYSVTVLMLIF